MKLLLVLFLFGISIASYTSSYSTSTCKTYEDTSTKKWCRYSSTSSFNSGYAWDYSDTSSVWGGSSSYRWSSQTSYLPGNSKRFLCPTDSSNCNDQLNSLTKYTDSVSVTSGWLGSGFDYCWYRFRSEDSSKSSLSIYISGLYSGSAEVHYESSSDVFEYKGTLSNEESINVNVSYYKSVWVYVTGTFSSSRFTIKGYYNNSSSSNRTTVLATTFWIGTFVLSIIATFLICLAIRRPKVKEFNQQHAAASIINQQANTIPIPTNVAINPANVANASAISQQPFNPSAPKMIYTANGSIDVNYSQQNREVFNLQPAQQPFYAGEGQYFNNGANVQPGIPV